MHYARAMHPHERTVFAPNPVVGWGCVFLLSAAYALAIAHGVVSIDVARDLYWAQQILRGDAFPLLGPPVGSTTLLGPVWYYVLALVLSVSGSLTAYFCLLGVLAASKFALAYVVGRRWLGSAFGLSLAVASALPGIASYQLLGIGHPWFVESILWLTAYFALRLRGAPTQLRWAVGLGAAAALALHAHPTAILLLPWALPCVISLPAAHRWRALLLSALAAFLCFAPALLATLFPSLAATSVADNAVGPNSLGSLFAATVIAQNLLWTQAKNIFDTLLPQEAWGAGLAFALFLFVLAVTLIGARMAWQQPRLRPSLVGSLLSLIWVVAALSILRNHTPFYMAFVALLPLTALMAVAWVALRADDKPWWCMLWICALTVVLGLHGSSTLGLLNISREGRVDSYLPLHSNMQDVQTQLHRESVVAAPTRDALARWLCAQPQSVSLHGDVAAAFDTGLGVDTALACRAQTRSDDVGGNQSARVGLPLSVWRQLSIQPQTLLGAYALVAAQRVLSPASALPRPDGRRYPPRFAMMIAALRGGDWSVAALVPVSEVIVVSSLLPTLPNFSAMATANGIAQTAIISFANTAIFRCDSCAGNSVEWIVKITGGLPEAVSITTVARTH